MKSIYLKQETPNKKVILQTKVSFFITAILKTIIQNLQIDLSIRSDT